MAVDETAVSRRADAARSRSAWRRRALLLAYGALVALLGTIHLERAFPAEPQMMPTRAVEVQRSLDVLADGGPPLLGYAPEASRFDYDPVPPGEPPGIYLYLPLLGHALGEDSPPTLSKWLFLGAFALLLLVFPVVVGELFRSLAAGIAAPVLLLLGTRYVVDSDLYWVQPWVLLLCLPPVLLAYRHYGRRATIAALAGVLVVASAATAIRYYAGLPVLLAALLVVLLRERAWRRRLGVAAILVAAYASVTPLTFAAVREYRDASADGTISPPLQFSSWHSMYIGLGYLDNPYGIRYDDNVAARVARDVDPDVTYLGPGYGDALRRAYVDLARRDPSFVAENVVMKVRAIARDAVTRYWPALLLVPLLLLFGRERREARVWLLLLLPAFALTALPPVTVIPLEQYELGWLGAWALLWVLGLSWVVAALARAVGRAATERTRIRPLSALPVRRALTSGEALLSSLVVLTLVSLALIPESEALVRKEQRERFGTPAEVLAELPPAATIAQWRFEDGLPGGWGRAEAVQTEAGAAGLDVLTGDEHLRTQLAGPPLELEAGAYRVAVSGEPRSGGILLALLDLDAREWTVTSSYTAEQQGYDGGWMILPFVLDRPLRARIVLVNLRFYPGRSRWLLREVVLQRTG